MQIRHVMMVLRSSRLASSDCKRLLEPLCSQAGIIEPLILAANYNVKIPPSKSSSPIPDTAKA